MAGKISAAQGPCSPIAPIRSGVRPIFPRQKAGFTVAELLTSLAIISILMVLASAGLRSVIGTQFDSQVSDLASTLVRARAYAMANNTYAFVGISETNASVPSSAAPQTAGTGRLGVTILASNDGTRGYNASAPSALSPSALTIVSPLRQFENLHLLSSSGISNLPNASSGTTYNISAASANSLTTFPWPLSGTAQYTFGATPGSVIQFNPEGQAQIMPTGTTSDNILQWIEIDLEPTSGSHVPTTAKNTAAILIAGSSGAIVTYRP